MKKYFFTGLITLLPLALTLIVVIWLFDLFTAPVASLTESLIRHVEHQWNLGIESHKTLTTVLSRIVGFILLVIFLCVLGLCGQKFLNNFFMRLLDRLFLKIPLVRTIYRLSHDVTKALFSDTKKTFRETVLVPFPHKDVLSVGFVTGDTPEVFKQEGAPHTDLAIFIPTAPHPMSGFVLLSPKELVYPTDVSIEDGFKFLLSCGVIGPGEHPPKKSE